MIATAIRKFLSRTKTRRFAAGAFWNIEYSKERGTYYAFTQKGRPGDSGGEANYPAILARGWPFALLMIILITLFILDHLFKLL